MNPSDATDLPSASGHRFGPELSCSECGVRWDEHQRNPRPCHTEPPADAFERRPVADAPDAPDEPLGNGTAAKVVTRDGVAARGPRAGRAPCAREASASDPRTSDPRNGSGPRNAGASPNGNGHGSGNTAADRTADRSAGRPADGSRSDG